MTRHLIRLIWNRKRQSLLLTFEILLAFLVLFGVTVGALQYASNWRAPLGFEIDRVWSVEIGRAMSAPGSDARAALLFREMFSALRTVPNVESAAGAFILPYSGSTARSTLLLADGRGISHQYSKGTDDLRDLLNIRLLSGRWFSREDDGGGWTPVVVNQRMATELFGDRDPVNERIAVADIPAAASLPSNLRVVGVIEDFRKDGELVAPESFAFYRLRLDGQTGENGQQAFEGLPSALGIRLTPGTTAAFEETLVRRLQAVAPDWTYRVQPLSDLRARSLRSALAPLMLAAIVTVFLLLMVALGLTGVVWQSITTRTPEFGLRRANGATGAGVRRQVLSELVLLTSLALAAGVAIIAQLPLIPLTPVGVRLPSAQVWVSSIAASIGTIYLLTLLCGLYPSRLATSIQPADALRYE